nr:16S rRNA (guanine(527)-N(7))-methyltransferase RsmG [Fimbriimonas ginsengisoli]
MTGEQLEAFAAFHEAIYAANAVMNLTRVPPEEAWLRHYLDSILFQDLIPVRAKVLDLGTGPGFPSWPLACARPDLKVTALDSSGKMLGFLRTQPLSNLEVVQGRAEEFGHREKFEIVTGRAVAPLAAQLEVSAAPCAVGGFVIPMRTPNEPFDTVRLEPLGLVLRDVVTRPLAGTDVVRAFPRYEKLAKTDRKYPRRWAEIKEKGLGL